MENLLDKDLQDMLDHNKSRYQKTVNAKRVSHEDDVDSTWFPTYQKSYLGKLKDVVKVSVFPLVVYTVFFWWLQTGSVDNIAAVSGMSSAMVVMGFRICNALRH